MILTHTAPLKYEPTEVFLPMINQNLVDKSTEQWLDSIEERLGYQKWYCGHYHTIKKIDDKDEMCYECSLYGDNLYLDESGELVYRYPECPFNGIDD